MKTPVRKINAKDPEIIMQLLQECGDIHEIDLHKTDKRTAIRYRYQDRTHVVEFLNGKNNKNHTALQFRCSWGNKATSEDINRWNSDTLFSKAYLDEDGDPVITMDLNLEKKVSEFYFKNNVKTWHTTVMAFAIVVL